MCNDDYGGEKFVRFVKFVKFIRFIRFVRFLRLNEVKSRAKRFGIYKGSKYWLFADDETFTACKTFPQAMTKLSLPVKLFHKQ